MSAELTFMELKKALEGQTIAKVTEDSSLGPICAGGPMLIELDTGDVFQLLPVGDDMTLLMFEAIF